MRQAAGFALIWRFALACALFPGAGALAQYVVPPGMIQKQAERDQKLAPGEAAGGGSTTRPAAPKGQRDQVELLKTTALGPDQPAAMSALHKLQALGDPAKLALRDVVRQLLASDRAVLAAARTLPAAGELRDISDKIAAERKDARANINKLAHDQTIKIAHTHYDSLKGMWEKLHGVLAQADATAKALSRRGELLAIWHEVMPADKQYSDDAEAALAAKAEKAFGFTSAQLSAIPQLGEGDAPAEPVLRDVWFYRAYRRIEAYNARAQKFMSSGELLNAQFVNAYREYLGILPYELDPRLVDAARTHTQEMVSLKYFAHESPVPANKTPWDRIKIAGYKGGSGENIAKGTSTGDGAFWMWFDSPPHHQNMASLTHTGLGVGNQGATWTQDMGAGKRMMFASPEEQKAVLGNAKPVTKNG
jgi:uncharacterized protein YkwD